MVWIKVQQVGKPWRFLVERQTPDLNWNANADAPKVTHNLSKPVKKHKKISCHFSHSSVLSAVPSPQQKRSGWWCIWIVYLVFKITEAIYFFSLLTTECLFIFKLCFILAISLMFCVWLFGVFFIKIVLGWRTKLFLSCLNQRSF